MRKITIQIDTNQKIEKILSVWRGVQVVHPVHSMIMEGRMNFEYDQHE